MAEHQRWQRVDELFHLALELEAGARSAFLTAECGSDAELRELVAALLRAHGSDVPVLDGGPELLASVLNDEPGTVPHERIGPYRVVRELGRGGMGVVYLAEREDSDFRQIVALKSLLPGLVSDDLIAHFRRERRILAALVHPNIAQLHDGGITESGDPYFVMEYVDGEPLDTYCDRRRLDVNARLQLFATVCEAVQYAHQHLVVHRDLKPGNVLVTADGHVKLLDFGVAKLLERDGSGDTGRTRTMHALTPVYASPEQIQAKPVTAASDVFSLGLILFELLTGRRAFSPSPGAFGSMQVVLQTQPARASGVVGLPRRGGSASHAGEAADSAAARGTTPERLERRLRGDLDIILEKALRKDPAERYASAQSLVDDIRRHLEGLPIHAQPPTRIYRASKFVRRHRTLVAAGIVVLLALSGGLTAATWQGTIAARERDAARGEAAKAQRVTDFLVSVFEAADPAEARGDTLTAREILDRGARKVEAELAAEPAVQATVQRAIGRIYGNLAEFQQARVMLERSLETHEQVLGPDDPEVAADLHALADIAANVGLRSDSLYLRAIEIKRKHLDAFDPGIGHALHGLGQVYLSRRDYVGADTLLQQALSTLERAPGGEGNVGRVLNTIALGKHQQGEYEEAERRYREALALQRRTLGEEHPGTLETMSNLGWLLQLVSRYEAADSVLRETLAIRRRVLGARHTRVAATLHGLAETAYRRGHYVEAEELLVEALEIRKERWSGPSAVIADNLLMLGSVLAASGRIDEAHARYREAFALLEEGGYANTSTMARAINNHAALFEREGDHASATAAYRRAWGIYRDLLGEHHSFTSIVLGNIGSSLLRQDSVTAAEPLLRTALSALQKAYSEDHNTVAVVLADIGSIEMRKGALTDAEQTLRRAVLIQTSRLPAGHWRIAQAQVRLARCLNRLGQRGEAEPLLLGAFEMLEKVQRERPREYQEALLGLEELYSGTSRTQDAQR